MGDSYPVYDSAASADSRNSSPRFDIENGRGVDETNANTVSGLQVANSSHSQIEEKSEGMSFAKMLRTSAAKSSKPECSVTKSETFPGLLSLYPKLKQSKNVHSDSEPEVEGYVPPPPKQSIGDALAQALEQACTVDNSNAVSEGSTNPAGQTSSKKKGKKMKGKKILLSSGARPHL